MEAKPTARLTYQGYVDWYRENKGYGLNEAARAAEFDVLEDRIYDATSEYDLRERMIELLNLVRPYQ